MSSDRDGLSRRSVIAGAGAGLLTLVGPASASTSISSDSVSDTLTEAAIEAAADPRRRADELGTLADSRGDPTWVVEYGEDDLESLEEWADHDDREILEVHEPSRTAVVRATTSEIGAGLLDRLLDRGLASRGYVETIDANPILELAEPIESLEDDSVWGDIEPTQRIRDRVMGAEVPVADGLAFDDVETATMADVAAAVNAEDLDAEPTIAVVDSGVNVAGGAVFGYDAEDEDDELDEGASGTRVLESSRNIITDETVEDHGLQAIEDANGHGTFVAAQIAGNPSSEEHRGILPEARILGIKALGDDGTGSTADIASAIRYAADEGVDAIVLSLGSPAYAHELDRALEYAAGAGAIPVAAVGNDRAATRWLAAPSSSERAISVASVTVDGDSSYYSNVGPHPGSTDLSGGETRDAEVDVAAPGHSIETTVPTRGSSTETRELSGTSMAAPVVAAIVAALDEDDPDEVRETLRDAAEPIEQAAEAEVGAGLVDAERALAGGESDEDQSDAMSEDAEVRDEAYRIESDARGRTLLGWL